MRLAIFFVVLILSGCGLETAGTAVTVGKLQADQAKQAKAQADVMKADLDAATRGTDARNKAVEEAGK